MTMPDKDMTDETTYPEPSVSPGQAVLDGLGGPWGMVCTAVPVVVFATAVAFVSLPVTVGIAIVVASFSVIAFLLVAFVVGRILPRLRARAS